MRADVRALLRDDAVYEAAAAEAYPRYNKAHLVSLDLPDRSGDVSVPLLRPSCVLFVRRKGPSYVWCCASTLCVFTNINVDYFGSDIYVSDRSQNQQLGLHESGFLPDSPNLLGLGTVLELEYFGSRSLFDHMISRVGPFFVGLATALIVCISIPMKKVSCFECPFWPSIEFGLCDIYACR
jgi:hypothetical protein